MYALTGIHTLDYILFALTVLFIAWIALRILRLLLSRFLKRSSEELNVDPTKYLFLKNGLNFVIYLGALIIILYSIPTLKTLGVSLFAGAGILAAIIGFASQAAFSNIISGIFIVVFKPFRVGDVIKVGDRVTGRVEDITLRHTVIRNFENRRFILPNSLISSEIILNSSIIDEKIANFVFFSISYETNLDYAINVMREEVMKHPLLIDNRDQEELNSNEPVVVIRVVEVGDFAIKLRATCWSRDFNDGFIMQTDLLRLIKLRYDKEGIEIPYPHRTLVNKKDGKVL
jgi:small-conductance mechanosensitive channel